MNELQEAFDYAVETRNRVSGAALEAVNKFIDKILDLFFTT